MRQSLMLWHGLLKATGCNLVPNKCFWYLINFHSEGKHLKYKHWEADQRKLQIPKDDGTIVTIPCLNSDKAQWTLGVRLALDGNNTEEFKYLQGVTAVWKNHMVTAKIPHAAADFALCQVLLPKLRYPLIATTLMEKQCQAILKLVLQQGLPAMGVNQNLPHAVVHGPRIYQGLNIPNLYSEQMITHIQTILKFGSYQRTQWGH